MTTVAGDVIDIEYTADASATAPVYNLVGKTSGEVSYGSNVEAADVKLHESQQLDKSVTSEAWEIEFAKLIQSTLASLRTLGLVGPNDEMKGYSDSRENGDPDPQLRITVYDSQADKDSGNDKWQITIGDFVIVDSEGAIPGDDYATRSFVVHARERPVYAGNLTA